MSSYNINTNSPTPTGSVASNSKTAESPLLKKIENRLLEDDVDLLSQEQVQAIVEEELKKEGLRIANNAQKWALKKLGEMFKGSSKKKPKVDPPPTKETAPPSPTLPTYPSTTSPNPQTQRTVY